MGLRSRQNYSVSCAVYRLQLAFRDVEVFAAYLYAGCGEIDVLCRILFLNLHVDNKKVASYLWREPFATLVKATALASGGAGWS